MRTIGEFIKSILAGAVISIGGIVYLSCENKAVGALLFSVGLISVVMFGLNLYTGRIGYVPFKDKTFLLDTILSIPGNLLGCLAVGLAKMPVGAVGNVCAAKLDKPLWAVLVDGILCGVLIFVCVDIFKKHNRLLGILVCIPTFILSGFEHSIADMFYFFNARIFTVEAFVFILVAVVWLQ